MQVMSKLGSLISGQAKLIFGVAVGVVIGGSASAAVLAAIPDSSGAIHACYKSGLLNNSGQVRIIDGSQSCNSNETAASWNSATAGPFVNNLVGADFTDTSLSNRNFTGADLHGGKFGHGLSGGSPMNRAVFKGANLSLSTFFGSIPMDKADFTNANFSGSTFNGIFLIDSTKFTNANFSNSDFQQMLFQVLPGGQNADLTGANFRGANISSTSFDAADISGADFSSSTLENGSITSPSVVGTNFTNAHFSNFAFGIGPDYSQAIFTGATWSNVTCPDQTNSDNNGNTCIGHLSS
jgi:uncharacterized protein YjbI with pentapeptide repeats